MPPNWEYNFYLKTNGKTFSLFASSSDERKMWMAGFLYVIASTKTV